MKKIMFLTNFMCVFAFALAQDISPLVSYKTGKANYSIPEMAEILKKDPTIAENWGSTMQRIAWRDGWAKEIDPEFFKNPDYIIYALERSKQVKVNFKKGDFSTFGKKSDGTLSSIERDPYPGERFLSLDPNDLESENLKFSRDFPAFVYASSVCMNGVDVYSTETFSANRSSGGYTSPAPGSNSQGYKNFDQAMQNPAETKYVFVESESDESDTYIENNYYGQENSGYSDGYADDYGYSQPKFQFSVGVLWGANDGCWGHNTGYCGHGYGYQQFGYQPQSGGQPVVTNTDVYVNVINNNSNTNTNTNTNTNNPPANPGGHSDDPSNGDGPYYPADPVNKHRRDVTKNQNQNFAQRNQGDGRQYRSSSGNSQTGMTKGNQTNQTRGQQRQFTQQNQQRQQTVSVGGAQRGQIAMRGTPSSGRQANRSR